MVKAMTLQPSSSFRDRVDDGLHGSTIQRTIGIHGHLTGGIGDLLNSNENLHFSFYLLTYLTPRWLEMTIRCTSEVPS